MSPCGLLDSSHTTTEQEASMEPELIVTERCRGLYKTEDNNAIAHCEHPISHLGDCGPDTIARAHTAHAKRKLAEAEAAARLAEGLEQRDLTARLLRWIAHQNSASRYSFHTSVVAPLTVAAALWDETGEPVRSSDVANICGIVSSTVDNKLKDTPYFRRVDRGLWVEDKA